MKAVQKISLLVLVLLSTGCVSSKVYRATKSELLGYQASYGATDRLLDSLQTANALLEQQLNNKPVVNDRTAELEDMLAQREAALFEIRSLIDDALESFEGKGLSITQRDGKIYVSMDEKLLFESGKAEVSHDGERAIRQIARVLENNPDINITIEGHTDNKGYIAKKDAQIVDNWDLSVKRATEVVRIMLKGSSMSPARITAAGRSQYVPLAKGNSEQARAQNRRTEIILTPRLDKIMELLK